MPTKSEIGKLASASTKEKFAPLMAQLTSLTQAEAATLFPTPSDRDEIVALLEIVSSSATDNNKKAALITKIGQVSGAVLKLAKRFATGL
jgi:hypothetical protein